MPNVNRRAATFALAALVCFVPVSAAFAQGYHFVSAFGSQGVGAGQFYNPYRLGVDRVGNVFVSDANASRIEKFDNNGAYISQFGSFGAGNGNLRLLLALPQPLMALFTWQTLTITVLKNLRITAFISANSERAEVETVS